MKAVFNILALTLLLLAGCGHSEFSLSQSETPSGSAGELQDTERGVVRNPVVSSQSNADVLPAEPQPRKVLPPVPVIGSYLAGELLNESREALADAEVTLSEDGRVPVSVRTDRSGRFRLFVVNPSSVVSISTFVSGLETTLIVGAGERISLREALEDESGAFGSLFQLKLTAASGGARVLESSLVVPPERDLIKPIMSLSVREIAAGVEVTVTASDAESGLAAQAYSYDNGKNWIAANVFVLPAGSAISVGMVRVRDRANNIAMNTLLLAP